MSSPVLDADTSVILLLHNGVLHPPSKQIIDFVRSRGLRRVTMIAVGDNVKRRQRLMSNAKHLVIEPSSLPVLVVAQGHDDRIVVPTSQITRTLCEVFEIDEYTG